VCRVRARRHPGLPHPHGLPLLYVRRELGAPIDAGGSSGQLRAESYTPPMMLRVLPDPHALSEATADIGPTLLA